MSKTLPEIFSKYRADEPDLGLMLSADPNSIRLRCDKEQRIIEIHADFAAPIRRGDQFRVEAGIRKAYDLNFVRIFPHYPNATFTEANVPDLLAETNRMGIVANGFFNRCHYRLDGNRLDIEIPFSDSGVDLVTNAKTPALMEEIIRNEFGTEIKINIRREEGYDPSLYASELQTMQNAMSHEAAQAQKEYVRVQAQQAAYQGGSAVQEAAVLPRIPSIYTDLDPTPRKISDTVWEIGHSQFDVSEPKVLLGNAFEITPTAIATVNHPQKNIVFLGDVFNFTAEENRTGDKMDVTFDLFDGDTSIEHRTFGMEIEDAKSLAAIVKNGGTYAMRGYVKQITRKGRTDLDYSFFYTDIMQISKITRKDTAEKKRVELHLHTTMSTMDALIPPDVAVKTALKWGHPAVAITDHGNVQGFPDAMLALEKAAGEDNPFKVLYGIEAYFVNDTASAVMGNCNPDFNAETVVFDIETTGLNSSPASGKVDRIIEIGAVKMQGGNMTEKFSSFIACPEKLPPNIVELTGIHDEDLVGAPDIEDVLADFYKFTDGCALVGHNVMFDYRFVKYYGEEYRYFFDAKTYDTMTIGQEVLRGEVSNFKLNTLADYYDIHFNHHRAFDDALTTAKIFQKLVKKRGGLRGL